MGSNDKWENNWQNIKEKEALLWKSSEKCEFWKASYAFLAKHKLVDGTQSILVPLCGDCAFIPYAMNQGHPVVGCESVATAVEMLKNRINNAKFTKSDCAKGLAWKTVSGSEKKSEKSNGSLTIFNTDILDLPVPKASFDLIYDKDSLGAIPIKMREEYLNVVNATLRPGGHILLEVKLKDDGDANAGPPFHLAIVKVLELYGNRFELVDYIKDIYDSGKAEWKQQAFILQKKRVKT